MMYDYEGQNCVVTGGAGFLGQNIVSELIDREASVVVIDNFSHGATPDNLPAETTVVRGDIRDESTFDRLPDREYDYIFHFAAPSSIVLFDENPNECISITIEGFTNAVDWAVENDSRLVYPSSGSLYSGVTPPHAEKSSLKPAAMNAYAKSKRSLELIQRAHGSELDAVGLRIFAGYGPSEAQKEGFASVVHLFARDIVNGERPVIYGDGTQLRDFVYETDVAKASLVTGQHADESIVNVGSGSPISFDSLVDRINERAGTDVQPEYVDPPDDYLEKTEADTTRMEQYYSLEYTIEDGIAAVVESLR